MFFFNRENDSIAEFELRFPLTDFWQNASSRGHSCFPVTILDEIRGGLLSKSNENNSVIQTFVMSLQPDIDSLRYISGANCSLTTTTTNPSTAPTSDPVEDTAKSTPNEATNSSETLNETMVPMDTTEFSMSTQVMNDTGDMTLMPGFSDIGNNTFTPMMLTNMTAEASDPSFQENSTDSYSNHTVVNTVSLNITTWNASVGNSTEDDPPLR